LLAAPPELPGAAALDAATLDAATLDAVTLDAVTLDAVTHDAATLDAATLDARPTVVEARAAIGGEPQPALEGDGQAAAVGAAQASSTTDAPPAASIVEAVSNAAPPSAATQFPVAALSIVRATRPEAVALLDVLLDGVYFVVDLVSARDESA